MEAALSRRGEVYRFILKMVRDESLAEDVLQETYLRALKGVRGFAGGSSPRTWLMAIAKNEAYRAIGKMRRDMRRLDELRKREMAAYRARIASGGAAASGESALEQVKDGCLHALLSCLPFGQRCAFILGALNGYSPREVAAVLGKSENAARIELSRARAGVRRFLCGSCERLSARPSCRCEGMLEYSMKRSLIRSIGAAGGTAGARKELRRFRNEVELMRSLPENEAPDPVRLARDFIDDFPKG